MLDILHHLHRRKRIHTNLEPYPHPRLLVRILDRFMLVVAVIAPIALLPQIIKIYSLQDSADIAAPTWILLSSFNVVWWIYGLVHKDKPLIITHSFWFFANGAMVLATILF